MTLPTHLQMGAKIHGAVSLAMPFSLDRHWFLYGNIYPDLSHYLISAPHFAEHSMGFVKNRIAALCEYAVGSYELDPFFSMQLGVLSHYLCDFFCHVHSVSFMGSVIRHFAYELRQQAMLMRHPRLIGRKTTPSLAPIGERPADVEGIWAALDDAQAAYLSAPHRADTDLLLAVKISSMVCASVLGICLEAAKGRALVSGVATA